MFRIRSTRHLISTVCRARKTRVCACIICALRTRTLTDPPRDSITKIYRDNSFIAVTAASLNYSKIHLVHDVYVRGGLRTVLIGKKNYDFASRNQQQIVGPIGYGANDIIMRRNTLRTGEMSNAFPARSRIMRVSAENRFSEYPAVGGGNKII